MARPFLSVITPVRNLRHELPVCVESLCSQPFSDWELLLVDHASTDGSAELCDQLARLDGRISALHASGFGGPGVARNAGLGCARGEYVYFVDGDDLIAPGVLPGLVACIRQHGCPDVAYVPTMETCDLTQLPGKATPCKPPLEGGLSGTMEAFLERFVLEDRIGFHVWMALFRREFLERHHLRFQAHRISEDIEFTARAFCLAETYCTFGETVYYWRQSLERNTYHRYVPHGWAFLEVARDMLAFLGGQKLKDLQIRLLEQNIANYLEHFDRRFLTSYSPEEVVAHEALLMGFSPFLEVHVGRGGAPSLLAEMLRLGPVEAVLAARERALQRDIGFAEGVAGRDLYLFPANRKTAWLAWVLERNGHPVKGLLDNDPAKAKLLMDGHPILSPEVLGKSYRGAGDVFVVIATSRRSTGRIIAGQMRARGLQEGEDFICMGHDLED